MREKLYARQIERRLITILDVPERYREGTIALLSAAERERQRRILDGEASGE